MRPFGSRRPEVERKATVELLYLRRGKPQGRKNLKENVFGRGFAEQRVNINGIAHKQLIDSRFHRTIKGFLSLAYPLSRAGNVGRRSGIDALQQRQHLQPYLITHDVGHEITAVGDVILSHSIEKINDFLAGDAQQRAHHMAVARPDARQAVNTRATNEVHQQRLHGVVLMMSHTDLRGTDILAQLLKIAVAKVTRRHFNAYLMKRGVCRCVKMN